MYAQSYRDAKGLSIPEGYDGTAISTETEEKMTSSQSERKNATAESVSVGASEVKRGFLSELPFGNILSGILGKANFGLHKIGFEEILLAIGALYLFFAKDGDKECAIMLAILLFIN